MAGQGNQGWCVPLTSPYELVWTSQPPTGSEWQYTYFIDVPISAYLAWRLRPIERMCSVFLVMHCLCREHRLFTIWMGSSEPADGHGCVMEHDDLDSAAETNNDIIKHRIIDHDSSTDIAGW